MAEPVELETERLRLRPWRDRDRAPFAELNADPRVMEHFPALLDREASDAMAARCEADIARRGWGLWAAELKATGAFIGFVGLSVPGPELPFSPCVEVGWRLAFPYWGRGLATEGARASVELGFDRLGLGEIVSFTTVGNWRSRRVMERLGMEPDPETFEHPGLPVDSPLREHCLYRLSRAGWQAHGR